MKKIFQLQEKNKKPERTLDAIKNEVRKYLKRERKKKLPDEAIFWEFDCKFGKDEASAVASTSTQIIKDLDLSLQQQWPSCYIEIIARPSEKKTSSATLQTDEDS